jgi:structure-specific recognition protein 1
MNFNVQNKLAFEVPLTDIANTSTAGKNDVAIEFVNNAAGSGGAEVGPDGRKIRVREDSLVEMHFYIPGMAVQSQVDDQRLLKDKDSLLQKRDGQEEGEIAVEDEELVLDDEGEALTAAAIFCETIKNRADVSVSQGDSIVSFEGLLCLTPRYFLFLLVRKICN